MILYDVQLFPRWNPRLFYSPWFVPEDIFARKLSLTSEGMPEYDWRMKVCQGKRFKLADLVFRSKDDS